MLRSYLLLSITMILFSGNILVGKAIHDLPPATITFVRCFISFLILLPIGFLELKNNRLIWLKEWKPLLSLSLSGIVMFNFFLYASLQFTTSTNVAVIETTTPVFAVLLGLVFLKERLRGIQLFGILLSLLGAFSVITKGDWLMFSKIQFNIGDILAIIAVMAWAVYSLLIKKHNHKFPLYGSLTIMLSIALIVLFPFAFYEWREGVLHLLEPTLIIGLLYLGIFPSVIALIFWNKGVAEIGPSRASVFLNLLPVFTIIGAVLFLGETVTYGQLIGGVVVIFGVYLTTKKVRLTTSTYEKEDLKG
ncbi:DMT family transporter [Halalkalibacter urbisdiaboli]|uniref:DMT family transporter n=1 Tax=Halalkalibacter urbisdiaboli TaxID=1960589 RepID=UPI000B43F453|nr:EamA family transporter [Halalkalibacter urbisdiaboli]